MLSVAVAPIDESVICRLTDPEVNLVPVEGLGLGFRGRFLYGWCLGSRLKTSPTDLHSDHGKNPSRGGQLYSAV